MVREVFPCTAETAGRNAAYPGPPAQRASSPRNAAEPTGGIWRRRRRGEEEREGGGEERRP